MKTKLKILHLEDTPADAELVERELKKANIQFEKLVVANKIAFEKALKEFAPDIIISDHTLPSFDSLEAIKMIKRQGLKIPIILVTATVSDEYAVEIMKAGADDYILKDRLHRLPQAILNAMEKNRAEEQLYKSETFNKGVLSSLSSHITVIDKSGILIAVNKTWDDFAYENGITSLDQVSTGSNYFDACKRAVENGDSDAAQALAGIESVFKKERQYFEMEYPCHSPQQQRWFILSVKNFGSDTSKVVISHQNITERKIAENNLSNTSVDLQKTLFELNNILDSSLDVICTINADGEFVNVSAASRQVWGYTPEELIGSKFMSLVYAEDIEITTKAAEKIVNNIQVPIFENRYVHKSGRVVPILWSVNWDEKLGLMYCVAKDATEKKRLEKAVEKERDQFFDMFSKAPSAIGMLKGADHVFEIVNLPYLQLIGKEDVTGKTVAEVLPEIAEQGFIGILDNVYATGKSYIGTEVLIKFNKEGNGELTDAYVNFIYQAYRNDNGDIAGIFFFANDITEQILSRKAIEKSEKFFKGVIENSDDMITIIDTAGKTIYASPAVSKKFGYTPEEILKLNLMDVIHPDDIPVAGAFIAEVVGHPSIPMQCPVIRERKKDGSYIWVEGTLTNFLETEGINAIVANFRDITEREMADEQNRFKVNLLNTIGQAAIATDMNGVVSYWNKAAENIYGWTMEEAIGKNIINLTPSYATREQSLQIMDDLKNGRAWSGEFRVQRKDGTDFPALVTDSPIYDPHNKLSGIIGISSDITEKKKLEALLDKSNRLARIGSWEIDVDKGTVFWSDITKGIFEADPDFIPSLDTGRQLTKEGTDRNTLSKRIEDCIEKEIPWDEELQITSFKGNLKWIRTIGEAEIVQGKCSKLYGSLQDITERKKAERERIKMISDIVQRNSDLEQFSYIVSHNLRAPAANIIGLAEILQDETLTPQEQKESLQGLSTSVAALDTIIKDINNILQVKSEVNEKKEVIIFSKLVNDIIISVGNLIDKHRVRIISDFSEVNEIYSLKVYIYSIFYNLIINSIKYSKPNEPPRIEIKSKKENGKIMITFKDNGLGIDMKTKGAKIFGLYNRFHSHVEGKGMGLFMVKTQVESLGGKITIASEVNKGTEFTVELEN